MTHEREPARHGVPVGERRGPEEFTEEHALWEDRTRVFLQPVAAPSILGLFGLAAALMMVGAWMAGWYGSGVTPLILFPFVLMFGGLAQFLAGMWSYRARDGLATAVHGTWGAFWLGFGLLYMLAAMGSYPVVLTPVVGQANAGFGFWFVALCVITGLTALAALGRNMGMAALLIVLSVGAGFTAAGFWSGATWPVRIGGWLFVVSSVLALYAAAAMLMEDTFGRTLLPMGKVRAAAGLTGRRAHRPLEYPYGQPGVRIGQ
ncbi:acetate uptake transporter family protein [Actinomadura keratinilytica]|jgi:succinate-acetate transporter protein|uniref:GPR1/FUN34/yaaH family protein n=1 Tax=Actinomadura keratinilytica TaxID=547461 RepID=A0ABP7ZGX5_9ACTN